MQEAMPVIDGACHCGAVRWEHDGIPQRVTVCNCTMCRRLGALWAYGYDGAGIRVSAPPGGLGFYAHGDRSLAVHFCLTCGNTTHWRALAPETGGPWGSRTRIAVNMRLAAPAEVRAVPLHRFDGFDTWTSAPADGRCIADLWF